MYLDFVRCPHCGNERDFDVTLRYQRRPHNYDLDADEDFSHREQRHYRPDKLNDQQPMRCRQCGNTLTYGEARQEYKHDVSKMTESALVPTTPLPPLTMSTNQYQHSGNTFVSGVAYQICLPGGIGNRTVPCGVTVEIGYLGKPSRGKAILGALYHMDDIDIKPEARPSEKGYGGAVPTQGKMSFEVMDSEMEIDDLMHPVISPETIESLSERVYARINLHNDETGGEENLNDIEYLFGSGGGDYSYGTKDIKPVQLYSLREDDIEKAQAQVQYGKIHRQYKHLIDELQKILPKGWHASLKVSPDMDPFLVYTGRSPLKNRGLPTQIDGVPVYYGGGRGGGMYDRDRSAPVIAFGGGWDD